MSDRPTPLTDEAIRDAGGKWTFLARDLSRDLERKLAEALEALGCIAKGQSWESLTASDALARIEKGTP